MNSKATFDVENVGGTTVIGGFGEEPIRVAPGERVTIEVDNNVTAGEIRQGIRQDDCAEEEIK